MSFSVVRFTDLIKFGSQNPALKELGYFHSVRFADEGELLLQQSGSDTPGLHT